jgi:dUTP pyrophosphatase
MNVKKLRKDAILPTKATADSAGFDLYSPDNFLIYPGTTEKINTGLAVEIPHGFFGGIFARSGLATKQGLAPANKVGVIDADYRGPLIVALHNHGEEAQSIKAGDRIAQLVILPVVQTTIVEVEELDETERGEGGFGSTGK